MVTFWSHPVWDGVWRDGPPRTERPDGNSRRMTILFATGCPVGEGGSGGGRFEPSHPEWSIGHPRVFRTSLVAVPILSCHRSANSLVYDGGSVVFRRPSRFSGLLCCVEDHEGLAPETSRPLRLPWCSWYGYAASGDGHARMHRILIVGAIWPYHGGSGRVSCLAESTLQ